MNKTSDILGLLGHFKDRTIAEINPFYTENGVTVNIKNLPDSKRTDITGIHLKFTDGTEVTLSSMTKRHSDPILNVTLF